MVIATRAHVQSIPLRNTKQLNNQSLAQCDKKRHKNVLINQSLAVV